MKGDMGRTGAKLPRILKPGETDVPEDDFFCYACRDTGEVDGVLMLDEQGRGQQKKIECDNGRCQAHRHFFKLAVHVERELCAQVVEMLHVEDMPNELLDKFAGLVKAEQMTLREVLKAICRGTIDTTKLTGAGMIRERRGP